MKQTFFLERRIRDMVCRSPKNIIDHNFAFAVSGISLVMSKPISIKVNRSLQHTYLTAQKNEFGYHFALTFNGIILAILVIRNYQS